MKTAAQLPLDNPFWNFSLQVYATPEAAAECLDLQRMQAININVLLFCSWIAVFRRVALTAIDIELIENDIQRWHALGVLPLRDIRDRLKPSPEMQFREVQEFRHAILEYELRAEQIEQAMIFECTKRLSLQQSAGAIRDILTGNIHLLRSLAAAPKPHDGSVSVYALIETSLAAGGAT